MSTLTQLVAKARRRAEDEEEPYLWSSDEWTEYLNDAVRDLLFRVPGLLVDRSTVAIVKHTLLAGASTITLSDKITSIHSAKLESQDNPLTIFMNMTTFEESFPTWEQAEDDVPLYLIHDGYETGTALLHPPTEDADVLWLTVTRLPTSELTWSTDQALSPSIPERYHHLLVDGMMAFAYLKDDTDTADAVKAKTHEARWNNNVEQIKRAELHRQPVGYQSPISSGQM